MISKEGGFLESITIHKNQQLATNNIKNQERRVVQPLVKNCEWINALASSIYSSIRDTLSKRKESV